MLGTGSQVREDGSSGRQNISSVLKPFQVPKKTGQNKAYSNNPLHRGGITRIAACKSGGKKALVVTGAKDGKLHFLEFTGSAWKEQGLLRGEYCSSTIRCLQCVNNDNSSEPSIACSNSDGYVALLTASQRAVRTWKLGLGEPGPSLQALSLHLNEDQSMLYAGLNRGYTTKVWDIRSPDFPCHKLCLKNIRHGLALPGATTSLYEKAGLCFAASDSGICAVWDLRKAACPVFVTRDNVPGNMCLAVDRAGACFVTGSQDCAVRAYSVEKRACLGSQTYHRSPLTAVRIMVSERAANEPIFTPTIEYRNFFVEQDGMRGLVAFCGSQDGSLSSYCMYSGHGTSDTSSTTVMTSGSSLASDSIQEIYTKNGSSCRQALVNVIYRSGTLERWAYHEDTSTRGGRRDGLAGWELSSSERHFSGGQIWCSAYVPISESSGYVIMGDSLGNVWACAAH